MDVTFIDDEHIEPTESFIQSGKSLREAYVLRAKADLFKTTLDIPADPNDISKEDMADYLAIWTKEAEILYPDEGDYRVWIISGGVPVPLGSVVEFIGGDVRENTGGANTICDEYLWDLSAEPDGIGAKIEYTSCRGDEAEIVGITTDLKPSQSLCSLTLPVSTVGVISFVGACSLPN